MLSFLNRIFNPFFRRGGLFRDRRHRLGWDGERLAARHLRREGMKLLLSRYRCRWGEVDWVVRDRDTLVFVEVKTRQSELFGNPSEAVTRAKQKRMSRVALDYLQKLGNPEIPLRFDIVEVTIRPEGFQCHHIRDAFPCSEPYLY